MDKDPDKGTMSEANENEVNGTNPDTFKTPSFIIPSKKKVQSEISAAEMFKSPELPIKGAVKKGNILNNSDSSDDKEEKEKDKTNVSEDNVETIKKVPGKKTAALSPAEQIKQSQSAVPYREPSWSTLCEETFAFEVIKNGAIIDNIDLTSRAYHVIGRLPSCDIPMEHPSLSRYHAVVQYSNGGFEQFPKGWYLFDLDSTHGTWINKNKVPSQKFHRIHVDYVLKFGGSTRLFIVKGPDSDREEESELSAKEMYDQREKQTKEAELLRQKEIDEAKRKVEILKKRDEAKGCSWGIDDDEEAEEEDENAENPFAKIETENEALYINDPKKALNRYFEREGLELPEYEFHEAGFGKWKCSMELPIDAPSGEPLVAEVVVSGKKKDAVVACAMEACKLLDMHGELRKSAQESRKRKQRNWEDDDFYDSDEDVYLDRTGAIEKKREQRKNKVGKSDKVTETYDSLQEKHKTLIAEIEEIEAKLEQAKAQAAAMESDDIDVLDAYMSAIKSGMMDTKTKMKLKRQLLELRQEEQRVRKLVNIAKPATLPEITKKVGNTDVKKTGVLSSIGKMKGPVQSKLTRRIVLVEPKDEKVSERLEECEEEEEEIGEKSASIKLNNSSDNVSDSAKLANSENSGTEGNGNSSLKVSKAEKDKPTKVKGASLPPTQEVEKEVNKHETNTKSKRKGPSMPLAAVLERLQADEDEGEDDETEITSGDDINRKLKSGKSGQKKQKTEGGDYYNDPDYAVWLPPENQSGDGKTHLNAKLGY